MRTTTFLLISEGLLILAIILVCFGLKGNLGFNAGWPLEQFSITVAAESRGATVALAFASIVLAAVTLVAGLVGVIKEPRRSA